MRFKNKVAALAASAALALPVGAHAAEVVARISVMPTDPLVIAVIDRATQEMVVTVGDGDGAYTYGPWEVSTARTPYRTPAGTYEAAWLDARHWSREFHARMPFAVFFDAGRAVHAATPGEYALLGTPASHGCVRLSLENAQTFFELVKAYGKERTAIVVW